MTLIYRFKKEKLEDGVYVSRPRILIALHNNDKSIDVPALIDSGCDTTVIPEGLAKFLGLDLKGKKSKLYAYKESTDVIQSTVDITFIGKALRQSVKLNGVPVLVALSKGSENEDEAEVILGITRIFDEFDITFKKSENKIIFKIAIPQRTYSYKR